MFEHKKISGQGLIEFALLLPILILLTVGALELGVAFYIKVALENSAREGAYYMVYHTAEGKADEFALAIAAVQLEAVNSGVEIATEDIDIKCILAGTVNNDCPPGSTVVVTVSHAMPLWVDIFSNNPLLLANEARMLIP